MVTKEKQRLLTVSEEHRLCATEDDELAPLGCADESERSRLYEHSEVIASKPQFADRPDEGVITAALLHAKTLVCQFENGNSFYTSHRFVAELGIIDRARCGGRGA